MATAGEKIAALAVDLQASLDAAHAQSAEFADAFGRLNLALGTAVTAAELPDVVRKRLAAAYVDQEERAGYRARAEAAEKRAQDAEQWARGLKEEAASLRAQAEATHAAACGALNWACKMALSGPQPDRAVAELVSRYDAQKAEVADLHSELVGLRAQENAGKQEIAGLRRSLELSMSETRAARAQVESLRGGAEPEEPAVCSVAGCKADLSRSANGCTGCDRLLCAEHSSPIIFRPNVELPDIGVFCPECVAVLRREFTREMAVWLAALVQATINLAPYPPDVADAVVAIVDAAINALPPELRPTASAQSSVPLAAVFYGGPSAEHYIAKAVRTAWIRDLIASLPSPSEPKAGRWKCRRCSKEQKMNQDDNVIAAWIWNGVEWRHYCTGELQSHAGDRIGDAPEVTP